MNLFDSANKFQSFESFAYRVKIFEHFLVSFFEIMKYSKFVYILMLLFFSWKEVNINPSYIFGRTDGNSLSSCINSCLNLRIIYLLSEGQPASWQRK